MMHSIVYVKLFNYFFFSDRYTFLAPEIFLRQNQEFTKKTDIWAFGLTIWQLFTLMRPFGVCNTSQVLYLPRFIACFLP